MASDTRLGGACWKQLGYELQYALPVQPTVMLPEKLMVPGLQFDICLPLQAGLG